jgi:transposase
LSCKKTRLIPSGAPEKEIQKKFAKRIRRTIRRIDRKNGVTVFIDPTHQVYNTVNGYCWQEKGAAGTKKISSSSGRKRITVIGAVNAVTHKPTAIITEDNCDKEMIKQLLRELRKDYANKGKIYAFLDNARYSWNKEVRAEAKRLNIKLIFLPPYSPNLNLIERLWKFLKKKIKKNVYYSTFKKFKKAIFDFFKNIEQYESELKTLLTLRFEII